MVWLRIAQGRNEEAERLVERILDRSPDDLVFGSWASAVKGYLDGDYQAGIDATLKHESAHVADIEIRFERGRLYCLNGDVEDCIRSLRQSVESGYANIPWIEKDPIFDVARNDPRFQAVAAEARKRHEALAARFGGR